MRRIDKITTALTLACILAYVLPQTWIEATHVGDIPLGAIIFAVLGLVVFPQLLRNRATISIGLAGSFAAFAFMIAWGYYRDNVGTYLLKFYAADIVCFAALLTGYSIARIQRTEGAAFLASRCALFAGVAVVANYVLLYYGFVGDVVNESRYVTTAIFESVGVLVILLPWAASWESRRVSKTGWRVMFLFVSSLGTAAVSATRSLMVAVVAAGCLYFLVKRDRFKAKFLLRLVGGGALLIVMILFSDTTVFNRLGDTNLAEEDRTSEVLLMWPQISDDLLTGQGMGSRFVSTVIVLGDPLAIAPHIGILAFLLKGGYLLFFAFAVVPLFVAFRVLFSATSSEGERGAAASVIMYLVMGSLSGGWTTLPLFVYGLALGSMNPQYRTANAISRLSKTPLQWSAFRHENSPGH